MTQRGSFIITRRHFVHATAAASASGLLIGRAHAADAVKQAAGNYALELDGKPGAWLSSVTLPEHVLGEGPKGDTFSVGPFQATHAIAEPGPLFDWIMSLPRKQVVTVDGAVVMTDHNFAPKRRCDWTVGHITSVKFPKLSASEGKKAFLVDWTWQPETVAHREGKGKKAPALPAAGKGTKALSAAHFRVVGLPGESEWITDIELPTITAAKTGKAGVRGPAQYDYANIDIGELKLTISGRSRASLYKYVQGVIEDGKLTDKEKFDLSIELLDVALTKTLATVQLYGCGLRSYKEPKLEANKEETSKFTLTFSVERFDLNFAKAE